MQHSKANIRYARALYDLAEEQHQNEAVYQEMVALRMFFAQDRQIRAWMSNPVVSVKLKKQTLADLFQGRLDGLAVRFLNLIVEKNRSADVDGIIHDYVDLYRRRKGIAHAVIGTPQPLNKTELKAFEDWCARNFPGVKVEITNKVAPRLIGGFTFRVGWQFVDCSVAGRLHRLRKEMLSGDTLTRTF
ncbi:MAG: ATP synthase F1 subunit delta [Bacteroides sp.]|nr:ATP synthase F1 subunit delta [Ruminococcus flavefaciens]MCM1554486.1 ATP synthase F1 subunit delta [Bacteroides sp.]